jgi:glycosyltransferase involved in cell wall biosynthesis
VALDESIEVGIKMLTYNHGSYIAQAIEGVLMQKVNFKIKLYIGDDCSTDNTYEIVESYKAKYPEIIECYSNKENLGVSENSAKLQSMLKGKYIAFCEGDDYWVDPLKLAKQHAILNNNLDYNVSVGRYKIWHKDQAGFLSVFEKNINLKKTNRYSVSNYLKNKFSQTSTFFLRNDFSLPYWFKDTHLSDQALLIVAARDKYVYYHDDLFSVYRVHNNGISSKISVVLKFKKYFHFFIKINEYTGGRYLNIIIIRFITSLPMFLKLYLKSLFRSKK